MRTTVDRFGRIVLPKKVRDSLGLTPGTPLEVEELPGVIQLRPIEGQPVLVKRSGVLVYAGTATGDVSGAVDAHRASRIRGAGGMDRS
jgi:AbrB family looped-hinge helix DNA binding protein